MLTRCPSLNFSITNTKINYQWLEVFSQILLLTHAGPYEIEGNEMGRRDGVQVEPEKKKDKLTKGKHTHQCWVPHSNLFNGTRPYLLRNSTLSTTLVLSQI